VSNAELIGYAVFAAAVVVGLLLRSRGKSTAFEFEGRTFVSLDDFLERQGEALGLHGTALNRTHAATSAAFSGKLPSGREAQLTFREFEQFESRARLPIDGAPRLTITLETWRTRLARAVGLAQEIEVGVRGFDDRYFVETDAPLEAGRKLARSELREAIDRAFRDFGVTRIEIGGGYLVAQADTIAVRIAGMILQPVAPELEKTLVRASAVGHRALLEQLDRIARLIDRRPIQVTVLGGERFAFLGQGGKPRCPYCRVDLTGAELDLVACDRCSTVLHGPCWEELGRCPVLGCPGSSPERAPGVRARD
jgi:hypothetical protein